MDTADFNADGRPDAVWTRDDWWEPSISVTLNLGDGTLDNPRTYPTTSRSTDVETADLDGDVDTDIAVSARGDGHSNDVVDLFLNDGAGGFTHTTTSGGEGPESITTGDVDDDGDTDLVLANYNQYLDQDGDEVPEPSSCGWTGFHQDVAAAVVGQRDRQQRRDPQWLGRRDVRPAPGALRHAAAGHRRGARRPRRRRSARCHQPGPTAHGRTDDRGCGRAATRADLAAGLTARVHDHRHRRCGRARRHQAYRRDLRPRGNDELRGVRGGDVLRGGAGNDRLLGGEGVDVLAGASGNDQLGGANGADLMRGANGDDELSGGAGRDVVDLLDRTRGNDVGIGGVGRDHCRGDRADTLTACD